MAPKENGTKPKPAEVEDDERTRISKTITWILRRGAKALEIDIDANGWVKIEDLKKGEGLGDVGKAKLMQVINESNVDKARYQVSDDQTKIRAFQKEERASMKVAEATTVRAAAFPAPSAPTSPMDYPGFNPYAAFPPFGYPPMMHPWMNPYFHGWPGADAGFSGRYQGRIKSFNSEKGFGFIYPPMMHPWMNPYFHGWPGADAGFSGRYQGRIKSFNSEKGFGFIECYETHALYSRDVFLHKAQVGEMHVGQFVAFTCELNKQNMPQAKEITPIGGQPTGVKGKGKGKGKGEKGGEKGKGKGKGKEKKAKEEKKEEAAGEEKEAGATAPEAEKVADAAAEAPKA
eukprot:CAMPEP_0204096844 /NCGR_PEP_ID=MMETSP0360-20130528/192145_1 /ASSEMBLY_ACC=CAM_ASM_000342 /TAXON_ID=268821 /ORGANISM="Scrippsiella Hangoei, Strain SHTV-5" /LENGTH=344 /DNA_ID=CAMNT_0051046187 /DNA_START=80 /DNA_END=1114 /DNA_ORIENTATION=-